MNLPEKITRPLLVFIEADAYGKEFIQLIILYPDGKIDTERENLSFVNYLTATQWFSYSLNFIKYTSDTNYNIIHMEEL